MNNFTSHIYSFILPLFVGNVLHMIIVKRNYLSTLAKPISMELFGSGKTYRAFIVMPLVCGLSSLLLRSIVLHEPDRLRSFAIGFILGFIYLLGELPNSYLKRRMGISPGQSHPKYKAAQYLIDKTDSLVPLCIVYYFISGISAVMAVALFVVSFLIHVTFSWLLFRLKIKKSF